MSTIAIISPCFNEASSLPAFLTSLDTSLAGLETSFKVVMVDDGSTDDTLSVIQNHVFASANIEIQIISLAYNMGHQVAIYQGLVYVSDLEVDEVIVMDADGEDDPIVIPLLIQKKAETQADIIHVLRKSRENNLLFMILYHFYRLLFKMVTGKRMNFGHYCLVSKKVATIASVTSFVHFPAYLSRLKLKRSVISADRKKRLAGKAKMNLTSLMNHAFKSFVEYGEELLMVFFRLFLLVLILLGSVVGYILYRKLLTDKAVLGWASTLSSNLFNTALICLGFFILGTLLINVMNKQRIGNGIRLFRIVKD